jgi:hypothetical protein
VTLHWQHVRLEARLLHRLTHAVEAAARRSLLPATASAPDRRRRTRR